MSKELESLKEIGNQEVCIDGIVCELSGTDKYMKKFSNLKLALEVLEIIVNNEVQMQLFIVMHTYDEYLKYFNLGYDCMPSGKQLTETQFNKIKKFLGERE